MSLFAKRLKEARIAAGLSQERLGVLAGIEEASASARMNQYERGKHQPDFLMVERISKVLNFPESYFYTKDDTLADISVRFHRANETARSKMSEAIVTIESELSDQ